MININFIFHLDKLTSNQAILIDIFIDFSSTVRTRLLAIAPSHIRSEEKYIFACRVGCNFVRTFFQAGFFAR